MGNGLMKAIVKKKKGAGNIELMEVKVPLISNDEVLIQVKAIGVCGTDYHIYLGEYDTSNPVIIGHEFSGEIVEAGNKIKKFKKRDRVISELNVGSCGFCRLCKTGNPQVCPSKRAPGTYVNGAYAEYIKMPAKLVHKIPDNVSFEEAAVVEPAAIVAHSLLERTKIEPEDFIVIFGLGPIGLLAVQMAKIYGARAIVVVGIDADEGNKFRLAEKLGADYIFNASKIDVNQKVLELTNGFGADLVVECSGNGNAINTGINLLRKQGRMCVIGIPGPEKLSINWKKSVLSAHSYVFNFSSSPLSWDWVLSMMKRKVLNIESLITHREPLKNWEKVFNEMKKGNVIKAILYP